MVEKSIFRPSGPLGSLDTRIEMAYLLGCFSYRRMKRMKRCKDIRNRFAHSIEGIDFSHYLVADHCNHLPYPSHYRKLAFRYKDINQNRLKNARVDGENLWTLLIGTFVMMSNHFKEDNKGKYLAALSESVLRLIISEIDVELTP